MKKRERERERERDAMSGKQSLQAESNEGFCFLLVWTCEVFQLSLSLSICFFHSHSTLSNQPGYLARDALMLSSNNVCAKIGTAMYTPLICKYKTKKIYFF